MNKLITVLLFLVVSANAIAKDYFNEKERGYWWYQAPPVTPEKIEEAENQFKPDTPPPAKPVVDQDNPIDPREVIAQQAAYHEFLSMKAAVYPTPENIKAYMKYNEEIMVQSEDFSTAYSHAGWTDPELNYGLKKARTKEAVLAKNAQFQIDIVKKMDDLSDKFGLLYFMRSDCPYCKRYSPILKQFAEKHGFTIYVVSLDSKGTEEFPYPKSDHYLAKNLNVTAVPALFLASPSDRSVTPVHYGIVSETQLVTRIVKTVEQLENIE
jgi:conjugal transfer pilus assembly protein TraF